MLECCCGKILFAKRALPTYRHICSHWAIIASSISPKARSIWIVKSINAFPFAVIILPSTTASRLVCIKACLFLYFGKLTMSAKLFAVWWQSFSAPAAAKKYAPSQIPPTTLPCCLNSSIKLAIFEAFSLGSSRHEFLAPINTIAAASGEISSIVKSGFARKAPNDTFSFLSVERHKGCYSPWNIVVREPVAKPPSRQSRLK